MLGTLEKGALDNRRIAILIWGASSGSSLWWSVGFGVLGFRGYGFRVEGLAALGLRGYRGFRVWGCMGIGVGRIQGLVCRVEVKVWSLELRV